MFKLYDFECKVCKNIEEILIENTKIDHIRCPKCGGAVKKLIAAPPFHLKGSNWAKDHYGLKKEK